MPRKMLEAHSLHQCGFYRVPCPAALAGACHENVSRKDLHEHILTNMASHYEIILREMLSSRKKMEETQEELRKTLSALAMKDNEIKDLQAANARLHERMVEVERRLGDWRKDTIGGLPIGLFH